MKDTRVLFFRKTLEELLDPLDAVVRVRRWTGPESVPEPLKEAAGHLVVRLGTAGRAVSSAFHGSSADTTRVDVMLGAMRRLDAAYVAYRKRIEGSPDDGDVAASTLDAEIDEVRSDGRWH